MATDHPAPSGESAPPEGRADHSDVLPDKRWQLLNDKFVSGAKLRADDFDDLLNLALEYHMDARRLTAEVARAEEDIRWLLDVGFWRVAHLDGCASVRLGESCDCRLGIIRARHACPCRALTEGGADR